MLSFKRLFRIIFSLVVTGRKSVRCSPSCKADTPHPLNTEPDHTAFLTWVMRIQDMKRQGIDLSRKECSCGRVKTRMAEVFCSCFHQRSGGFCQALNLGYTPWDIIQPDVSRGLKVPAHWGLLSSAFFGTVTCEAAEANLLDTGDMWPVTPVELLLGQICMWLLPGTTRPQKILQLTAPCKQTWANPAEELPSWSPAQIADPQNGELINVVEVSKFWGVFSCGESKLMYSDEEVWK